MKISSNGPSIVAIVSSAGPSRTSILRPCGLRSKKLFASAIVFGLMVIALWFAPAVAYPLFVMQAMCFALFACAFNLLIGYAGLMSFGHALYFGWGSYACAHLAKVGAINIPYWAGGWQWLLIPLPPWPPELAIMKGLKRNPRTRLKVPPKNTRCRTSKGARP